MTARQLQLQGNPELWTEESRRKKENFLMWKSAMLLRQHPIGISQASHAQSDICADHYQQRALIMHLLS